MDHIDNPTKSKTVGNRTALYAFYDISNMAHIQIDNAKMYRKMTNAKLCGTSRGTYLTSCTQLFG